MSRETLVAVEGEAWSEFLGLLASAVRGRRHGVLARFGARYGLDAEGALAELAALPSRGCAALDETCALAHQRCAGSDCAVLGECPCVESAPYDLARCDLASFIRDVTAALAQPVPAPLTGDVQTLRRHVEGLLVRRALLDEGVNPRARTSLLVLDLAIERGAPPGLSDGYLSAEELDRTAAFVPPASGVGEEELARVEAWLRQAASMESAVVGLSAS